jgi:single-stranded-DNA-specific exonuclease
MQSWVKRGGVQSESPSLLPPLPMPDPIWQILSGRGLTDSKSINEILEPKLKDLTHPLSLDDMDKALSRLIKAFKSGEVIGIYGDYDLDGTPGVALLFEGLKTFGFKEPVYVQPRRLRDGYGLHVHLLDELIAKQATLILTVDVGITDVDAVAYARTKNIDVIVTDHHLPKETLPEALAIINPNKNECGSGLKHLCGTGVAFYLLLGLKSALEKEGLLKVEFNPKSLLDLFALATVADMVPLIKENRPLVRHGLLELKKTTRPGLRRLLSELGLLGKNLNSTDIGFKIAPKLNALSRLDEGVLPIHVLLAQESEAPRVVEEALLINKRRLDYQKRAEEEILNSITGNFSLPYLFFTSDKFHPGVISVVANQLMGALNVPVFIGAEMPDGRLVGSARSPNESIHLPTVLESAKEGLHRFGGHALAAGFESSKDHVQLLKEKFDSYFSNPESVLHNSAQNLTYDAEVKISDINEDLMRWQEKLEPFGQAFEAPVYKLTNVRVKKVKPLKKGHFKYTFIDPVTRISAQGPWFQAREEFPEGELVDVLFELSRNEYMGVTTLQLMIKDIQSTQ